MDFKSNIMKNLFFTITVVILATTARSQNNLQLNRVLTFSGTITINCEERILDTVPSGKVWKIEAIGISGFGKVFKVNGKAYYNSGAYGYNSSSFAIHENIWLKAGDIISYQNMCNPNCNNNNCPFDYFVSALEFNLTQ